MTVSVYKTLSSTSAAGLVTAVQTRVTAGDQPIGPPFIDFRGFYCQTVGSGAAGTAGTYSIVYSHSADDLTTQVTAAIAAGKQPLGGAMSSGEALLQAMVDSGTVLADVAINYLDAVTGTKYHMAINAYNEGAADLAAFVGGAGSPTAGELTALNTRVNLVKADLLAHMASVGTRTANGEHLAAETTVATTLIAVPAATDTATACTLTIALDAAAIAHSNNTGKHFHNDAVLAAYSVSSDLAAGNATANKCRIEINALRAALATHFANGIA